MLNAERALALAHLLVQFGVCFLIVAALNWLARLAWDFYRVRKLQKRLEKVCK